MTNLWHSILDRALLILYAKRDLVMTLAVCAFWISRFRGWLRGYVEVHKDLDSKDD